MMKRPLGGYVVKAFALLLACCFCLTTALAEERVSLAPMLGGWLTRIRDGEAADITLSAAIHALSPYGVETLAAMNRLLSECRVQVGYQQSGQGEFTQTRLIIGDIHAMDFLERSGPPELAQTSLLPGVTLASASVSPVQLLLGSEAEIPFWTEDIPDPSALIEIIPNALAGLSALSQEKKVSYKIASVGTAQKALVYTVPEESAELLRDGLLMLLDGLNRPEASTFLKTLAIDGDAVITLYQSAEGENMGLGIKGTMGFENVAPRKVTFLWGFFSGEDKNTHTISLKAPAVKGSDNLTVAGEMSLQCVKDRNSLSLSLDIKNKLDNRSDRTRWTGRLDCLLAEDNQRLEGEIKQTYTDPAGEDHTLFIKPGLLALMVREEFSVKGSVRVAWSMGDSVLADVEFSVLACEAGDLAWEDTLDTVSLDELGGNELTAMAEKVQKAAVEAIWQAVMALPPECLTLISRNISQEDWERIYRNTYKTGQ